MHRPPRDPVTDGPSIRRAAELVARSEPFALATVVRRTAPSSARAGQKALILADGSLDGWLGGACIEPVVRREALDALADGRPRLVIFAPEGPEGRPDATERPDTAVYPMTCHSGGTVEIYVEPQLPAPTLALFGDSPVSRALAAMAPAAGYSVRAVGMGDAAEAYPGAEVVEALKPAAGPADAGPPATRGQGASARLFAVVATMGEWDEDAVEQALAAGAGYVGLVSSPRRASEVRRVLRERTVGTEALDRMVSPAGLDLGAEEPGEIAVTILAQLVQRRRSGSRETDPTPPDSAGQSPPRAGRDAPAGGREGGRERATAVDPVCGMAVEVDRARHTYRHAGTLYHFCCPRCRDRFSGDPDRFVTA